MVYRILCSNRNILEFSCRNQCGPGRLQQVCAEHDIVFIADEVVTAFGRLGHYFASEAVFGAEVRGSLGYLC